MIFILNHFNHIDMQYNFNQMLSKTYFNAEKFYSIFVESDIKLVSPDHFINLPWVFESETFISWS